MRVHTYVIQYQWIVREKNQIFPENITVNDWINTNRYVYYVRIKKERKTVHAIFIARYDHTRKHTTIRTRTIIISSTFIALPGL